MHRAHPVDRRFTTTPDGTAKKPSCSIWGILNVTPDSFSDGGQYFELRAAIEHGHRLIAEGADVVDVGGQSSRPAGSHYGAGATRISPEEEIRRVVPVIEALCKESRTVLSVDTVVPEVARAAIGAGARIVNDVSCGQSEPLLGVVASTGAELVLMHNRGNGEVSAPNTLYRDVLRDVAHEISCAVQKAINIGVRRESIFIDPGLGFAKTAEQSMSLLRSLASFTQLGHRVLVGPSRKGFIADYAPIANGEKPGPENRDGGTAVAVAVAVRAGVHAVRVHNVEAMRQAALIADALFDQESRQERGEVLA